MKRKLLVLTIAVVSLSSFTLVGMHSSGQAPASTAEVVKVHPENTPTGGMAMEDENQWN
jgi:hypothetical protein